jgi:hypothetical protein
MMRFFPSTVVNIIELITAALFQHATLYDVLIWQGPAFLEKA